MRHSQAFMLQSGLKRLEAMVMMEASLINRSFHFAWAKAKREGEDLQAVHARREHELSTLMRWWDYQRLCIGNQFSSLPPADLGEDPGPPFFSHTRKMWADELEDELGDDDPILQAIIDFCVAYMAASMTGAMIDLAVRRVDLLSALETRLKPAPERRDGAGDRVTTAVKPPRAPAPKKPRK